MMKYRWGLVCCIIFMEFIFIPYSERDYIISILHFAPGRGTKYCDDCLFVCLSVCPLAFTQNTRSNVTVHVAYVLLWLRCDKLLF